MPSLQEACVESLVAAARQMQRTTAMLERENGDLLERKLRLQARARIRAKAGAAPRAIVAPLTRLRPCGAAQLELAEVARRSKASTSLAGR